MFKPRWYAGFIGIVTLLLLALGSASAKDYCLDINSEAFFLVGQGFTIPPKGKCKPWIGFLAQAVFLEPGAFNSPPSIGTGCTAFDGSSLTFTITTSFPGAITGNNATIDSIALTLPSQTGTDSESSIGGGAVSRFSATRAKCSKTSFLPAISTGR